jgi:hypothetical protein
MLTQAEVQSMFDYHPDGYLTWAITGGSRKIGKLAGSFDKSTNYWRVMINEKHYRLHRIIFLYNYGYLPKEVDHIDKNTSNNKIENLRPCTPSQNCCNRNIRKDNVHGAKGVTYRKDIGKWQAYITFNKVRKGLGTFKSFEEAKNAYEKASIELHKEFSIYFNCSSL